MLFTPFIYATRIYVPGDYATIQEGINAASDGDSVLVSADTYYENIIWPATNGIKLIYRGTIGAKIIRDTNL